MNKNKLILISDINRPLIEKVFLTTENLYTFKNKTAVFLFFEPSTRTKISFELACHKLGVNIVHFNSQTSSLAKGESLVETLRNIEAMAPDLLIIRHGNELDIQDLYKLNIPIISAGSGGLSHPTQALLDLFTLKQAGLIDKNKKLLLLGDVSLNRLAKSHQVLLKDWGFKMAYSCPEKCDDPSLEGIEYFKQRSEALAWADIVMVLRLQQERKNFSSEFIKDYKINYQLTLDEVNKANLKKQEPLKVMHPGPYVEGLDLDKKVTDYKGSLIYDQVKNSVLVRTAIIQSLLKED